MEYSKKQLDEILEENKNLKIENANLQKMMLSKRYQFANKLANLYNATFSVGSRRRKVVSDLAGIFGKVKKNKIKKNSKKLNEILKQFDKVLIVSGITQNTLLPQRSHQLALEFSEHKDILVIYYEVDGFSNKYKRNKNNLITIGNKDLLFSLKVAKRQRGFFMFNNVENIALSDVEKMQENGFVLIYECIDELTDVLSGEGLTKQKTIMKKLSELNIGLLVSTAERLTKQLKKNMPNTDVLISKNAVRIKDFDYRLHSQDKVPADLKRIYSTGKKIVGYYGAISPWLDYDLIHLVAKKHPELELIFIGVDYDGGLKKLNQSIKNIHYLGPKKQSDLPKYAVRFNCGIIPFLLGDIAKSTSPIKLFEYMALGLPVVCTKDLVECRGYDYVYVSQSEKEFEKQVLDAVSQSHDENVKERLLEQAEQNSWKARAEEILKAINFID